ncbi:integral membrane protein [Microbacterium faecale]|uniref:Integral membrane protein n=1 Tax=Microbacterium faecale TaxID=1804630 RepID=A0A916Y3Q9_9MICO|nr:M56 family metallopeptidase [Microbacterium faecale]GGD28315.1 integral membrane protein [Microbacterium faecale]HJB64145.1 M56 family metallopeptidase [Candidatus Microbacterium pullistercoris]
MSFPALIAAVALALVAVVLAWPVPIVLSGAAWPARAPARALLLWQVVALAGGLSMVGALWLLGDAFFPAHPWLAGIPAFALALYLVGHLVVTIVQFERQRRRHLQLLLLLSQPDPTRKRTLLLDDSAPVAYCLPRGIGSVTVLSKGLLDTLSEDELDAVIAHERAHVEQRHEVLLVSFRAWRQALPWFPIAASAESEVEALVEMLADDHARRTQPDGVLARAILQVGQVHGGEGGSSRRNRQVDRFRRLAG